MPDANFPSLLQSFFTTRLMAQRKVSPHTIASYRDTFRLLLQFAQKRLRKTPSQLDLDDLDASFIGTFLDDLEAGRGNGARSRNLRLTAVRSFFRYAALEAPVHAGAIQRVLAIPNQRQPRALVGFLSRPEIDALLAAPNQASWLGRRDHAFLLTAVQTGLRLSEMTSLRHEDISLGTGAHVSLPRERAQGTLYSSDQTHRVGTQGLDSGTRQRRFQSSVSQRARRTFERRWRSAHGRTACGQGPSDLPHLKEETGLASRASPRRGDGTLAGRRGSRGDRALARTRVGRNYPDLFGRRPGLKRAGTGQDQTHPGQGWALSAG